MSILEKLRSLATSRRFVAALISAVVIAGNDAFGLNLDQSQILSLAGIAAAWIAGDSYRETE